MHIVAKAYEVTLCGNDLQTLHTILLPTDTALSPAYPSVMLHIAFKTLHLAAKMYELESSAHFNLPALIPSSY